MAEKYIIKILTLGDTLVGKSSIVLRYSENKFTSSILSTIGVDSKRKIVKVKGETVKVSIWDTAGQEKYQNIAKQYYFGANGVLLIYDITNEKSFKKIDFWYNDLKDNVNIDEMFVCLIGNKKDLESKRVITKEKAEEYAKELNIPYYEVSAKSGEGIKQLFLGVIEKVMDKIILMNTSQENMDGNVKTSLIEKDASEHKSNKCC